MEPHIAVYGESLTTELGEFLVGLDILEKGQETRDAHIHASRAR